MDFDTFKKKVKEAIPVGTVLQNPGGGTSVIVSYSDSGISYKRGNATIYVSFRDLFDAYSHFEGQQVTSSDLKSYAPSIYDSNARPAGHGCNCTFLFMVLCRLPLVVRIEGSGVRGDPFQVYIPK